MDISPRYPILGGHCIEESQVLRRLGTGRMSKVVMELPKAACWESPGL